MILIWICRLGFTSQADIVELKGRVACEISSGDELLLTEMLFQNVFSDLSAAQSVALLSCFVFDERASILLRIETWCDEIDSYLKKFNFLG